VIKYAQARRCRKGGFCFYRLEEPNGSDTYYALSIFNILGVAFHDERTIRYLESPEEVKSLDNVISYVYITGQLVPGK